eukprot:gene4753-4925_t
MAPKVKGSKKRLAKGHAGTPQAKKRPTTDPAAVTPHAEANKHPP